MRITHNRACACGVNDAQRPPPYPPASGMLAHIRSRAAHTSLCESARSNIPLETSMLARVHARMFRPAPSTQPVLLSHLTLRVCFVHVCAGNCVCTVACHRCSRIFSLSLLMHRYHPRIVFLRRCCSYSVLVGLVHCLGMSGVLRCDFSVLIVHSF